jgi:ribosomal protein S4E
MVSKLTDREVEQMDRYQNMELTIADYEMENDAIKKHLKKKKDAVAYAMYRVNMGEISRIRKQMKRLEPSVERAYKKLQGVM